ncbi:helix-turn-helix domain-containing protein [Streptomyces sp. NBC_00663]|uniref:helix-turn-helix domain-containing protein n=1 Tax=Streptomyces sp. NBC_00663 TaxID=2975801 RepID=UPI002E330358|nr:helix-turn-helix domain-containing protein [Streptomyces sp. NBC_00663]
MSSSDRTNSAAVTIGHLVGTVGAPVLMALTAPRDLDRPVRGTALHDPADPLPKGVDQLLLVPGLQADEPAATDLVQEAAGRGYCGMVFKVRGRNATELVDAASRGDFTLLAAADEISWRHLDALLLSVLGSQGVGGEPTATTEEGLFTLANAASAVIGGSVAIEDLDRRVMAYSSSPDQRIDSLRREGILSRRVPEIDHNLERYRIVLDSGGVVRFPEALGALPRAAVAIKAGTQPLGTVWAIESPHGISADGERALVDCARLAALHILRNRNANELELQKRESALLGALEGLWATHETNFRLSIPPGAELGLLAFAASTDAAGLLALTARLGHVLSRHVVPFRPDASIATTSRAIYVLLPSGGAPAAMRLAHSALAAIRDSFGDFVRAAVAPTETDPAALPSMRREVDDILRVTTAHPDAPSAATLTDVRARLLLTRVGDQLTGEPRLRHPGIAALAAHDTEHGTDFAASLLAWLEAVGNVAEAAARLGVHTNTLRYRLRRITELFGLSLEEPDDRLSVWLQLRLLDGGGHA